MSNHTYDEFPYLCLIRPDIHPAQLATLVALFKGVPPSLETCRVLELGCGNGINLITIAQSLPHATCLGIDYSAQQVNDGKKIIQEIGLQNITIQCLDILDFDDTFGVFDYILIHGVYSWVPEPVQKKLFSICQHHLAPQGIAYLSYNTYPGWHLNYITREMLRYAHTQQFDNTRDIHPLASQQLLNLAIALNEGTQDAYALVFQEQGARLLKKDAENYLRHDLLEEANHPIYFYQFLERLKAYQLDYVTDIKFRDFLRESQAELLQSSYVQEQLFTDFFAKEQYLDFFFGRKLRMSIICHQGISIHRQLESESVFQFHITSTPKLQRYDSRTMRVHFPISQVAVHHLTQIYPRDIFFEDLLSYVWTDLSLTKEEFREIFAHELLNLYYAELIELKIYSSQPLITQFSDYPTVSPLARWQASQGQTTIVNLLGQTGQLDAFTCHLLPHLNGKNNRQTLLEIMSDFVIKNNIFLEEHNVPFDQLSKQDRNRILDLYLEETLAIISKYALLVG